MVEVEVPVPAATAMQRTTLLRSAPSPETVGATNLGYIWKLTEMLDSRIQCQNCKESESSPSLTLLEHTDRLQ